MSEVFISYAREDQDFVRALHEALAARGRDTWIDWKDIPPTAEWLTEIYAGIEAADNFVFIISPDSVTSEICNRELDHAVKHNKRLVPVLRRETDPKDVPSALTKHQWIFFRECDDFDTAFEKLRQAVETDLEWVRMHTRLLVRAKEWSQERRDDSFLLRGKELEEAEQWLAESAQKEQKPTTLHSEYILASRSAETKRQRMTLGTVSVGLIVAVALALIAFAQARIAQSEANARATQQAIAQAEADARATQQAIAVAEANARATQEAIAEARRQEAERQRQVALARQLAAQAELLRNQGGAQLPLSVLLAIESVARLPSLEGDQALRHGLAILPRLIAQMAHTPSHPNPFSLEITSLVFSPDGRWLAAGSLDETVYVWDTSTWQEIMRVTPASSRGIAPRVRALAFSPDSRWLVSGGDSGVVQIWNVTTSREVSRFDHGDRVFAVTFSPDGQWVASGGGEAIRVWDARTGREISHVSSSGQVVIFSPDGKLIASGGNDGKVIVWETATGKIVSEKIHITPSPGNITAVTAIAFSPDNQLVASAEGDATGMWIEPRSPVGGRILVWEAMTGHEVARMTHEDAVLSLDFSPNSRWLVSGSFDFTARVWDANTGLEVARISHAGPVNAVVFSEDGHRIASGSSDGTARVWDAATGKEIARMVHGEQVKALSVHLETNRIATGGNDGTVMVWEIAGQELVKMEHDSTVSSVAFSSDGKRVVSASWDGTARVWDATTGREISRVRHNARVSTVTLSPNGRYVSSGSFDGTVKIWEATTGREIAEIRPAKMVGGLIFSPNGQWLAVSQGTHPRDGWFILPPSGGTVTVWEVTTGHEVARLAHKSPVNTMDFSPDSRWLVSGSYDRVARVWDVSTQTEIARLTYTERSRNHVNLVTFSPDGKRVASVDSCNFAFPTLGRCGVALLIVWDPATGQEQWEAFLEGPWVSAMVFSPDGSLVATGERVGDREGKVEVWEVATGRRVSTMTHESTVTAVAFSPNGELIASGSADHTVRIWSPLTGQEVARITQADEIWTLVFSPDGRWIVTGGRNGGEKAFIRVFPVLPEDLIAEACSRLTRNLTREEWASYIGEEPYRPTCPNLPVPQE